MRKIGLLILAILFTVTTVWAQPDNPKHRERIKALKIAYITEHVELSAEQAEKFWPVYNRFEKEMHSLHRGFMEKYRSDNPDTDPRTAHEYIDANLDFQEQALELKKKYKDEFLKVISAQQVADLYRAERGFKEMLLKELGRRQDAPPRRR